MPTGVNMKKLIITIMAIVCALCCAFALVACGEDEVVAVEDISLNKTEITLNVGASETLQATVTPKNATNKKVTWASANTDYVRVTNGKVIAIAVGSATVTAAIGEKSATCVVNVIPARMSAEEWAACVDALDKATNFTETQENRTSGELTRTVLRDGTKYFEEELDGKTDIYEKTGTTYTHYYKENASASWTQSTVDEEEYLNALTETLKIDAVKILSECYDDMDFDGNIYSLAAYDYDGIEVTDIEVYVSEGKINAIKFNAKGLGSVKIGNFGMTEIVIPNV